MLPLWCLSALLLFGPFAGQRKRGLRVGVCYCITIDTSNGRAASFSTGLVKRSWLEHRRNSNLDLPLWNFFERLFLAIIFVVLRLQK